MNTSNRCFPLHVVAKKLQSIRNETRFQDCLVELHDNMHDIVLVTETRRVEIEDVLSTLKGGRLYLSGGVAHSGVGIHVSRAFLEQTADICLHAVSPRLCMLQFTWLGRLVHVYSCYFPTAWDPCEQVEQLCDVLDLILDYSRKPSATPILGGHFNANVGSARPREANELIGM